MAQADWLGPKVIGHLSLFCIQQVHQMNCHNGCAMMIVDSTINIVMSVTIIGDVNEARI